MYIQLEEHKMVKLLENGHLKTIGILVTILLLTVNLILTVRGSDSAKIDKLDKQINGNGQEGVVVKLTRVETKVDLILEQLDDFK